MAGEVRRTLVVTNDFPPRIGGIESFVLDQCRQLPPESVVVYTASMPGDAAVDAQLPFRVVRDRSRVLLPTPRVARRAAGLVRDHCCDHVVFGAAAPLGLLGPRLRRAGASRVVAMTHGHEVWWARLPGTRQLMRAIGDAADEVTYVSEHCRAEIAPALRPEAAARMRLLSPRVDPATFNPGVDGSAMRRRWGVGPDRPVVLAASRLVKRKGHDTLVRAWPRVLAAAPDAVLVIVGDGPRRRALAAMVRRRGLGDSVRLLPGVPHAQMPQVYAAADVFALPCRTRRFGLEREALGIVFLEAVASGLPTVVGRSGGAPETVVDGQTGWVVDPRDVDALAARLAALVRHL
jgi:phosphatidylinositol alpha-1,6-mannosyltransferase